MCGIAGFFSGNPLGPEALAWARAMADAIAYRGPDDSGAWMDQAAGVAFGHRRLAVIDVSIEGHQPMTSESGRFVLNYNGEIYNYAQLQRELSGLGHRFRGHSDTEVMLAAFEEWGLERSLQSLVGMFAFALWDHKNDTLTLVRDRMGEKPLYYGMSGGAFVFASELKAFTRFPGWSGEINRDALTQLLRFCYIPAPHSIYRGVFKLIPGTFLKLTRNQLATLPSPTHYWSPVATAEAAAANPFPGSEEEAIEQLESLLKQSIAGQQVADVPLGAFLSGGIDSSIVVALMQAQSSRPIRTFTIGFNEAFHNEAPFASAVAKHLGTEHTELTITSAEALAVIPKLPAMYDEPFADSSQIPTYLVSQLARQHVTVSLSGDGGDELFGGYDRYQWGNQVWKKAHRLPGPLRKLASASMTAIPARAWSKMLRPFRVMMPEGVSERLYGTKLHKLAEILDFSSFGGLYRSLLSHWQDPASLIAGSSEPSTAFTDPSRQARLDGSFSQMMFLDAVCYLPDDILVKLDRASMSVSLESRVPFLDHRLIEFAWRLPLTMKIRHGKGKWILSELLAKYVPRKLFDRPKQGFGVPIELWLRGPLRDWAEALLDEGRLRSEGFLDPQPIRERWAEHLSGKANCQYRVWDILMFQAWLEAQR